MRIDDFLHGPQALSDELCSLGQTYPGALPYVADAGRARRMGLSVSAEVGRLAVGLLDTEDQVAQVPRYTLTDQRASLPSGPDLVAVLAFLDRVEDGGLVVQWVTVRRVSFSLN